jgi:hypothetical protein
LLERRLLASAADERRKGGARHLDRLPTVIFARFPFRSRLQGKIRKRAGLPDRREIREQFQRKWVTAAHAGGPNHHVGAGVIVAGLCRIFIAESVRDGWPRVAEPCKIVIDVEDDRRNPEQCGFLHDPAQEHGLS